MSYGKKRAITAKAPKYPSFWRRQTQSAGSQSNGWDIFCIENWLSMERIERNGYLFQQHGSFAFSGMANRRYLSKALEYVYE